MHLLPLIVSRLNKTQTKPKTPKHNLRVERQANHPRNCFFTDPSGFRFLRHCEPQFLRLFVGDKRSLKELIDLYRLYIGKAPYKLLKSR